MYALSVGVDADGQREILGFDVATAEDGVDWLAFLPTGVQHVISKAYAGLEWDLEKTAGSRGVLLQPERGGSATPQGRTPECHGIIRVSQHFMDYAFIANFSNVAI